VAAENCVQFIVTCVGTCRRENGNARHLYVVSVVQRATSTSCVSLKIAGCLVATSPNWIYYWLYYYLSTS